MTEDEACRKAFNFLQQVNLDLHKHLVTRSAPILIPDEPDQEYTASSIIEQPTIKTIAIFPHRMFLWLGKTLRDAEFKNRALEHKLKLREEEIEHLNQCLWSK